MEFFSEYKIRHFVIVCLLYLPCICFAKAKEEAEKISKSIEFKFVLDKPKDTKSKPDTLKYLGIADDRLIFTDKSNKNIIFIKVADTTILKYKNNTPPYKGFFKELRLKFSKSD